MKIAVLVSGGVDSSVALRLLKEQGHELTAFYLKIWLEEDLQFLGDCPWEEDLNYVREVCKQCDVPLEIIPMQKEYFDTVVDYTISEVKKGFTPNPDVMCNNTVKFGLFMKKIDSSFEKIATGHYAQIVEEDGKHLLKKAPDPIKDQTYFLSNLKSDQLERLVFPIGHLKKDEVRQLAEKFDLPNKDRKDSQGICFLGKFRYSEFLNHYLGNAPGDLIEYETGEKIGDHDGFWYYTIGQRRGLKIGGRQDSTGQPWYVVDKDTKKNIIYISNNYKALDNSRDIVKVNNFNWFQGQAPKKENLQVKLRHGEHTYNCEILEIDSQQATIKLDKKDQGIAPGQFVAFYDQDICLGSAMIC